MLDKLNHYSLTNPASVYDEEALTALELAGRTASKVNEVIDDQNEHRAEIAQTVEAQNAKITARLKAQDEQLTSAIALIPRRIGTEVMNHIENGDFDGQINEYAGGLEQRLDNLLGSVSSGSTSLDAEVIDMRLRKNGDVYSTSGNALRSIESEVDALRVVTNGEKILFNNLLKASHWNTASSSSIAIESDSIKWYYNPSLTKGTFGVVLPLYEVIKDSVIRVSFKCEKLSGTQAVKVYASQNETSVTAGQYVDLGYTNDGVVINPAIYDFDVRYIWLIITAPEGSYTAENFYAKVSELNVYTSTLEDAGLNHKNVSDNLIELNNKLGENITEIGVTHLITDRAKTAVDGSSVDFISEGDSIVISGSGNRGVGFLVDVEPSKMLRIKFDISIENEGAYSVIVADNFYSQATTKVTVSEGKHGHVELELDPSYYAVYEGVDIKCVQIWSHVDESFATNTTTVSNLSIYQSKLEDNNIPTGLEDALVYCSGEKSSSAVSDNILVSPTGEKYVTQIDDTGSLVNVPVVPTKALFIGNSLLQGFQTFGMAASNSKSDYFYLFNSAVSALNSEYTAERMSGASWEVIESESEHASWLNNILLPHLSEELELVVIQLGDNINTDAKRAIFAEDCKKFLQYVRTKCPKCRVTWVGAWYQTSEKRSQMIKACADTGCKFIDIWDLKTTANCSYIGATWTDDNGEEHTITSAGVASHPNDSGFKAIANRLLYELNIVSGENYYS